MGILTNDLLVATNEARVGMLQETIANNSGLYDWLKKKNRVKPHKGGSTIQVDLLHRENAGAGWVSEFERLSTVHTQPLSFAEYDVKMHATPITLGDLEEQLNSGDAKQIDIAGARVDAAEYTALNQLSEALYSTGTGSGGKQIAGLQLYLSTSPSTGTVGGISRVDYTFWRNQVVSAASVLGAAKSVGNFKQGLGALKRRCTGKSGKPNLYVCDDNDYSLLEQSLQAIQQVASSDKADAGYDKLMYQGSPFVFDGGLGGYCPANTTFAITCEHFELIYVKNRNMNLLPKRSPVDQLASIQYLVFYGNLVALNMRNSGVFTA